MLKQNLLISAGLVLAALSSSRAVAQPTPDPNLPSSQSVALVHFVQGKAFGLIYPKYRVYANGELICKLGRKSHCQVVLPAGTTTFTANTALTTSSILTWGPSPALVLMLEAGKTYYLQGDMAAAGARIPNTTYGFTEVVGNSTKLAQIEQFKVVQALVSPAQ
jgi:hypothetical protein